MKRRHSLEVQENQNCVLGANQTFVRVRVGVVGWKKCPDRLIRATRAQSALFGVGEDGTR